MVASREPLFTRAKTADDLFLTKVAAAISRVPDDEKKWPQFVFSELLRECPFLSAYDVDIVLDKVDPEAGAGLGYAQVRNKTMSRPQDNVSSPGNIIRIPIIIQERRLQKFYIFECGKQTYPLTEDRVKQALLNPAVFDTDVSRVPASGSLIEQIFPPTHQRTGFGRVTEPAALGLSKLSSAPEGDNHWHHMPIGERSLHWHDSIHGDVVKALQEGKVGDVLRQHDGTKAFVETESVPGRAHGSEYHKRVVAAINRSGVTNRMTIHPDPTEKTASAEEMTKLAGWKMECAGVKTASAFAKVAFGRVPAKDPVGSSAMSPQDRQHAVQTSGAKKTETDASTRWRSILAGAAKTAPQNAPVSAPVNPANAQDQDAKSEAKIDKLIEKEQAQRHRMEKLLLEHAVDRRKEIEPAPEAAAAVGAD